MKLETLDEYCKFYRRVIFGKCLLYNDSLHFSSFMYICTTILITLIVLKSLEVPIQ